jgi:hypothetical protein
LKRNYVLMKTTELKRLWKLVQAGEEMPLTAADAFKGPRSGGVT